LHNTSFKIYFSLTLRIIFSKENRKKRKKKKKKAVKKAGEAKQSRFLDKKYNLYRWRFFYSKPVGLDLYGFVR